MQKSNNLMQLHKILAMAALLLIAPHSQAAKILLSGNDMNSFNANLTAAIAGLGHQSVFIAPNNLSGTSLTGIDAVWLDGFSQFGTGSWSADLVAFMQGGGKVFVQNPGFGSETFALYPLGAPLTATFTYPPGQETINIVDTTSFLDTNHSVNQGLNNAGLSNWNTSAYGYFINIGGFIGLTDTGTAGEWVTIATQVGAGYLVYTQQGVSQYLGGTSNPGAGSIGAKFLDNVVTLHAVPEPATLPLFLFGLAASARLAAKKGTASRKVRKS